MHNERLSDEEFELFVQYLHRFANHDVDIFARVEAGYPEHPVYVFFGRDYPRSETPPTIGGRSRTGRSRHPRLTSTTVDDGSPARVSTAPVNSSPPPPGVAGPNPAGGTSRKGTHRSR
jgi:hypothetical protein